MSQRQAGQGRIPSDQGHRDAVVAERDLNVVIDAGAGTGKTTLLVSRLVALAAPENYALPAIPIERMAAVTFTRRAAGELRLRIRGRLLRELSGTALSPTRAARLRAALVGLDTAYVCTIHSFADRLLRLQPMAAAISPSYDVVDEPEEMVDETAQILLEASQAGQLSEVVGPSDRVKPAQVVAVQQTLLDAITVGLKFETVEVGHQKRYGLHELIRGFIRHRDRELKLGADPKIDLQRFRQLIDELVDLTKGIGNDALVSAWLKRAAARLGRLRTEENPVTLLRELMYWLRLPKKKLNMKDDCLGDKVAWHALKALTGKPTVVRPTPLQDDLLNPLRRWMAFRLVRMAPVVTAVYRQVKARHQKVDQVDLLLTLRDLLRGNLEARRSYQRRFDHIFVDEFQDTDPLQAEILLFLCEAEAKAKAWDEVVPAPGKLTIVGDPKQSVYRFRRADIGMYDRARRLLIEQPQPPVNVSLTANFRSARGLIEWFNDRFERVLRPAEPGKFFDAETGTVYHQPLEPDPAEAVQPRVRVLDLALAPGAKPIVGPWRETEAEALAHYLVHLVTRECPEIRDPMLRDRRQATFGDIAVLASSTSNLHLLLTQLDNLGIPHTARGGSMFLSDPLHRQFLLGLRALADRDDGVAEAALLRPPFFALDLLDLVREVATRRGGDGGPAAERARAARDLVRDLRARRFERSPGATARDLLERTAIGRTVALAPNGAQRLKHLRHLCMLLEQRAADEQLDYDGATAALRAWVEEPAKQDPPAPAGANAVQVMTVHQAKGLEFPVVALWDGCALWSPPGTANAWVVGDDPKTWAVSLGDFKWLEPAGVDVTKRDHEYQVAERRRVVYVAATRARDLLIVPNASPKDDSYVCYPLLEEEQAAHVEHVPAYTGGIGATWSKGIRPAKAPAIQFETKLEKAITAEWNGAVTKVAEPRFVPMNVSAAAHAAPPPPPVSADEDEEEAPPPRPRKESRFGSIFGDTVHHAVGLVVQDHALAPAEAVRRAAAATGLTEHLAEAAADVGRAVAVLRAEGLLRRPGPDLRLEYPIAGAGPDGTLLSGYIDFVSVSGDSLDVVDFKTDQPPPAGDPPFEPYVKQVQAYAELLRAAGVAGKRKVRCGLLYTADGSMRWV